MKETGPNFSFQKGNIDMKVYRSENSISKELVDEHILNFLFTKAGTDSELLKVSDFSLEFLVLRGVKAFFKFNIKSGNKNSIEILLEGDEVEEIISLIQQYGSGLDLNPN